MDGKSNSADNGARATLAEPDRFMEEAFSKAQAAAARCVDDAVAYTELYPQRAVATALAAGLALRVLPTARIVGGVVRLSAGLLKPALLVYGIAKLWKKSQATTQKTQRD